MPHGVAVVDALKSPFLFPEIPPFILIPFIDLIRHGKNAAQRHHPHPPLPSPPIPAAAHEPLVLPDDPDSRGLHHRLPPTPMDVVESIVSEERRVKEAMPVYKGLEGYSLECKMGEYVYDRIPITRLALILCPQWCILTCLQGHGARHWSPRRR